MKTQENENDNSIVTDKFNSRQAIPDNNHHRNQLDCKETRYRKVFQTSHLKFMSNFQVKFSSRFKVTTVSFDQAIFLSKHRLRVSHTM